MAVFELNETLVLVCFSIFDIRISSSVEALSQGLSQLVRLQLQDSEAESVLQH